MYIPFCNHFHSDTCHHDSKHWEDSSRGSAKRSSYDTNLNYMVLIYLCHKQAVELSLGQALWLAQSQW